MKRVGWCLACARHTRIFFAAAAWHQQGGKMRTHACCAHAASSLTRRRLLSGGRDEGRSKEEQVFFVRWFCLHTHASNRWSLGGFGLQPPPCCCCCKTRAWRGKEKPRNIIPLCISFLRISVVASYGADCYEACL